MKERVPMLTMNDGGKIPQLGLGAWGNSMEGVQKALKIGFRHIDGAYFYKNQDQVGRAIKSCQIPRDQLFLTTKMWYTLMTPEKVRQAFSISLKNLEVDYVDLLLIHWPYAEGVDPQDGQTLKNIRIEIWKTYIDLKKKGLTKHIGVSNFLPKHIDQLIEATGEKPVVNQIINHPYLVLQDVINYCRQQNILVQSWSPLNQDRNGILQDKTINMIGENHNKSAAAVIIRWHIQNGFIVFPKSEDQTHLKQNFTVYDFELSAQEMQAISNLHKVVKVGDEKLKFMFVA